MVTRKSLGRQKAMNIAQNPWVSTDVILYHHDHNFIDINSTCVNVQSAIICDILSKKYGWQKKHRNFYEVAARLSYISNSMEIRRFFLFSCPL